MLQKLNNLIAKIQITNTTPIGKAKQGLKQLSEGGPLYGEKRI